MVGLFFDRDLNSLLLPQVIFPALFVKEALIMSKIRAKAVCLFRHQGRVLLAEGQDPVKDSHYLLPIGGGVDFGETSEAAAIREVKEEIGADAVDLTLLGVSENIFEYNGKPGHEIVFVYEGFFADKAFYQQDVVHGVESNGMPIMMRWIDQTAVLSDALTVFPDGIKGML